MYKIFLFFLVSGSALVNCTSAQTQLEFEEVNFSEQREFWAANIKGQKSINLKSQFTFQLHGKDFFCTKTNGLVYFFDMGHEKVIAESFALLNDGYTDIDEYYVDKSVIAWAKNVGKRNSQDSIYTLTLYDYKKNNGKEKSFILPKGKLLQSYPVILDTNKILIDNLIFYSDRRSADTLDTKARKVEARTEGRTFMRRNMYITDNCFEAKDRCSKDGLSFTKIEGKRMITYALDPKNNSIPINTYRIEADFENLIFMSSKLEPNKFLIYDMNKHHVYPFQLNSDIFNLNRLVGKKAEHQIGDGNDEFAPNEVEFSYSCSMDDKNIYIGVVLASGNKFKTFKVLNYRKLIP